MDPSSVPVESSPVEASKEETQLDEQLNEKQENTPFPISVQPLDGKAKITLQVSTQDNVQDVRQFLFETPETCFMTHYQLVLNGNVVNDYVDIASLNIGEGAVLEMQTVPLDERHIRAHVRRLQDLMTPPSLNLAPSVYAKLQKDLDKSEKPQKKKKGSKGKQTEEPTPKVREPVQLTPLGKPLSLNDYYPKGFFSPPSALVLKSMNYTGWNPPPAPRKLAGDILYIEAVLASGQTISITASVRGYSINASTATAFHPHPTGKRYSTLVALLEEASIEFRRGFERMIKESFIEHPFEYTPVPFPSIPWLTKSLDHTFNVGRAESFLQAQFPLDSERGQLRDWNEEYQNCKELPNETFPDKLIRDRALYRINIDFVEAATNGAIAIVNGGVSPINPMDEPKGHMYVWNNIFFSFAVDGRDTYKEMGGDRAVYCSFNNDLQGIKILNKVDIKGLHTLITAIIDYKGHRLCAQGIIPGILQREQTSTVVYGSVDNGKTILSDDQFHGLMKEVSKELHLKECVVIDESGKESLICAPVETKGIKGTDGRKYVLDLVRMAPRDANFEGKAHTLTVLRHELVRSWIEHLRSEKREERILKARQSQDPEEFKKLEEEEITIDLALNPNVMCGYNIKAESTDIQADEQLLKQLASHLVDVVIPEMINGFIYFLSLPVDGSTLSSIMHSRGINLRYLGKVAELSQKFPLISDIAVREMICRACKNVLRSHLRVVEPYNLSAFIAHFLNEFFAINSKKTQLNGHANGKKSKNNQNNDKSQFPNITSQSIWTEISNMIKQRYQYKLDASSVNPELVRSIPTLRAICQKVGIQLEVKDYDLANFPFEVSNVIDLHPVVKQLSPESREGKGLLEQGKILLSQDRIDLAYELLSESLSIFHQVYGVNHRDTANAYANLALVLHSAKETHLALEHQQKAVIINERVLGTDHHDTIHSYGNLGLFYSAMTEPEPALTYLNHANYLGRLISGSDHPDTAATFVNIAVVLQESDRFTEAIEYLFAAATCYERLLGPNNAQNAGINHAIAQAYGALGQFKEALEYEKKNYQFLEVTLGPNSPQTVESGKFLTTWTTKAVLAQRTLNAMQKPQGISRDVRESIQRMSKEQSQLRGERKTAGGVDPSTPMWEQPLSDVLSYLGEAKQGLKQRNQKSLMTPSRKK